MGDEMTDRRNDFVQELNDLLKKYSVVIEPRIETTGYYDVVEGIDFYFEYVDGNGGQTIECGKYVDRIDTGIV